MSALKTITKGIYKGIPDTFKKQLLIALRIFYKPPQRFRETLSFKGYFKVAVDETSSFKIYHTGKWIENELFWQGIKGYEKVSMDCWIQASRHANVIFDVGANTGLFSLAARSVNSKATIVAFEPVPLFNELLQKNMRLNSFDITVEDKAVSDENKTADFYFPTAGNIYSATLSESHYHRHNETAYVKTKVQVCTLQSYMIDHGINKLDLIKIDAEGFDLEVLKGLGELLKKYTPDILVEIHSDETGAAIQELLSGCEYVYYNIDEIGLPKKQTNIRQSNSLNYFLCKKSTVALLKLPF